MTVGNSERVWTLLSLFSYCLSLRIFSWIRQIMLNFKHSTISFTRIRSKTRWMINNLHIGRIYVFEASQFLNHFLKNGIFACRHCLYKTALPNISHIYSLLKWNALTNDAFVMKCFLFFLGLEGLSFTGLSKLAIIS